MNTSRTVHRDPAAPRRRLTHSSPKRLSGVSAPVIWGVVGGAAVAARPLMRCDGTRGFDQGNRRPAASAADGPPRSAPCLEDEVQDHGENDRQHYRDHNRDKTANA